MKQHAACLPKPTPLPKTGEPCWDEDEYPNIRYVILGDDAFQLSTFRMKPYAIRLLDESCSVFNYRLSCFRICSENAFWILVSRFCIYFFQEFFLDVTLLVALFIICYASYLMRICPLVTFWTILGPFYQIWAKREFSRKI